MFHITMMKVFLAGDQCSGNKPASPLGFTFVFILLPCKDVFKLGVRDKKWSCCKYLHYQESTPTLEKTHAAQADQL